MAEKSEKLGLLLLFDCVAVILSTYGVLLLFQLVSHDVDTNVMIVSCFFAGIKILMMGIGDITGISKKIGIAIAFIFVADIIVFAINYFMAFGISIRLIGITLVADVVMIVISHLIWGKVFGASSQSEKKQRKEWLNNPDEDQNEEEYDDIFESLVTKDGNTDEIDTAAISAKLASEKLASEDEYDELFDEEEFEDEAFGDFEAEENFDDYDEDEIEEEYFEESEELLVESEVQTEDSDEDTYLDEEAFKALLINPNDLNALEPETIEDTLETTDETEIEEMPNDVEEEPLEELCDDTFGRSEPLENAEEADQNSDIIVEEPVSLANLLGVQSDTTDSSEDLPEQKENFAAVEERLGALLTEINSSTKGTEKLEKTVNAFKAELENLTPITTDLDILKTGDVIRDKLKAIIDKQFIVDEVLDDLIRLSQQINKRIDDLDTIEADLTRRKELLDKKELLYMNKKPVEFEDVEVQILPDEIMLENDDSEIIIDQGDLETIKKYLQEHPDL